MKRNASIATLLLALAVLMQPACQQVEAPTNRAAPVPAATPTVDKAAIEQELLRIENDWPRVLREKDAAAVRRVEADDAIFIYPDGSVGDKNQDIKDMESGALSADSWEMMDLKVNVMDGDAAVVSGRSVVKNGKYKAPDGKTIDISGEYRFVDTFSRRNGQWQIVAGVSVPVRQGAGMPAPPPAKASPEMRPSPAATQ
jgi:ketosteroid isomerase-like protein